MCWTDLRKEKGMRRARVHSSALIYHIPAKHTKEVYIFSLLTMTKEADKKQLRWRRVYIKQEFHRGGGHGVVGESPVVARACTIACYSSIDQGSKRGQQSDPASKPVPSNPFPPAASYLLNFPVSQRVPPAGTKCLHIWACGEHFIPGSLIYTHVCSLTLIYTYICIYSVLPQPYRIYNSRELGNLH